MPSRLRALNRVNIEVNDPVLAAVKTGRSARCREDAQD
ncbi:Uncharacterized protein YR821_2563 [Yersinia ruckeri]|nr:hypothetical protein yruck0001_6180 [Yersinia ruckeri ATCC 29473]QTD77481.1 Uncharacterized protein YR821_2563 [Yersinia ruckeri]